MLDAVLDVAVGHHALVGIFDLDPDAVGARELTELRLLARQLSLITRGLPAGADAFRLLDPLPDRLRQVALLVADGETNAGIAELLVLSEDTVKKYVGRILASTGCRSRTQLAVRVRAG